MASVLFSTIGQAVGGPLAAGIGAAVGASLDSAGSRRRTADDSYVQRSAYGEVVPRLFGTSRMAGHLVWALPPATGGGRKGDGRLEADASFAIALSSGPIREVKRIWADGREIRSADGQFAFNVAMRLHSAPVAQADPLIVAAEGVGGAPALRSLSHIVFEGFPLAPFGNRIPSLSFELVADEDGADGWLGTEAAKAGISSDATTSPVDVAGFASWGTSRSDDLRQLSRIAEISSSEVPVVLLSVEAIGRDLVFLAEGRGDPPGGTSILHRVTGQGLASLAPVHVFARLREDGVFECRWIERRRAAWTWGDEGTVQVQRYVCRIRAEGGQEREAFVAGSVLILDAQQQIALLGAPFAAGECQLEAVGDGPLWVRQSKWVGF